MLSDFSFKNFDPLNLFQMVASKYLHDTDTEEAFCNVDWATEFNLELKSLNRLEVRFLYSLDWCLFVSKAEFATFVARYLSIKTYHMHSSNRPSTAYESGNVSPMSIPEACTKSRTTGNCHFPSALNPRWPLAKAVTVFAAAFLAVSQPPSSTIVTGPSSDPRNYFDQLTTSARLVTSQLSAVVGCRTDISQNYPNFALQHQPSMPNSSLSDEFTILEVLCHCGSTSSHHSSTFASQTLSRCQHEAFILPPVGVS
uniref:Protein CNPPD1 n=1 Tax=Schistocephalus solidus TaxID=70667 RepID=A0A0X3PUV0_SCHSO